MKPSGIAYICPMPSFVLTFSFWQKFQDWDSQLFLALNHQFANPFFDTVLPFFRDSIFWAPLYLFILAFVFLNFGFKGLWWALLFIATVAVADLTGTYLFKPFPMAPKATPKPGYRMLAAIVAGSDAPVFFKLTGPVKTVAAAEAGYEKMLGSLKRK